MALDEASPEGHRDLVHCEFMLIAFCNACGVDGWRGPATETGCSANTRWFKRYWDTQVYNCIALPGYPKTSHNDNEYSSSSLTYRLGITLAPGS